MNRRDLMKSSLALLAASRLPAPSFLRAQSASAIQYATQAATGEGIPSWSTPSYASASSTAGPKIPEGMVYIPAGSFVMGSSRSSNGMPPSRQGGATGFGPPPGGGESNSAAHTVRLNSFCISKYLITNAQYRVFCDAVGARYRPGGSRRDGNGCYWDNVAFDWKQKANHPVLWVGYDQAMAYCKWVSDKTGWHVTLPSEAQWERAARGATKHADEFEYPWGNQTSVTDYKDRLNFNVLCAIRNGVAKKVGTTIYPYWPFIVEER